MEQNVKPFEKFFSGSHLVLGDAGSGKTKLIWSILQDREFVKENSINIVLTDSEKRMWAEAHQIPVKIINPYHSDISWATNPSTPGIYYCACDYVPRIITFMECLATWAIQNEKAIEQKLRIFIDLSSRTWMLPEFIEQVNRLHFIASSQEEDSSLEIWAVLGRLKKLPPQAKSILACTHLILMNPISASLMDELRETISVDCDKIHDKLDGIQGEVKEGYYYFPSSDPHLYLQPQFSK